jgi:glutathione S-transferase
MLKIWGRANSVNVQKVMWTVGELAIPHERIDAGLQYGVVNTPEYRKLNPNGRVPTIEDGSLVLWESNAIVRYLYAKYGPRRTPEEIAAADKWMDWTAVSLNNPMRDIFWGFVRTPPEKRDAAAIEAARKLAAEALQIADDALAHQSFLSGTGFGMGDVPLGAHVFRWFELPIERPAQKNLTAWYERLKSRPAYQKHVMLQLS